MIWPSLPPIRDSSPRWFGALAGGCGVGYTSFQRFIGFQGDLSMADHSADNSSHGMEEHTKTYAGFVKGSVALSIICAYVLVALVSFRFAHTLNVFTGFAGLIIGIIAVLIDTRTGGKWYLSGGLLVLFGLITAVSVS